MVVAMDEHFGLSQAVPHNLLEYPVQFHFLVCIETDLQMPARYQSGNRCNSLQIAALHRNPAIRRAGLRAGS